MSSSPAQAPVYDPNQVASTQATYNKQAAIDTAGASGNFSNWAGGNNVVQTGTMPDGTPIYSSQSYLSPLMQNLWNTGVGTQQTAANQASNLLSGANYGAVSPTQAIGDLSSGLTNQLVQQETNYLNPFYSTQTAQLDTQLRNQGFDPSSPAYKTAMNNLVQSQVQGVGGFIANTAPQMFSEANQLYTMPAQLAESLGQYGQYTNPNTVGTTAPSMSVAPPNYESAVSTAEDTAAKNADIQNKYNTAMMSGMFGIGSSVLGGWAKGGGLSSLLGAAALA
jgi:hypothetical protein